jgi:hypothetical protein
MLYHGSPPQNLRLQRSWRHLVIAIHPLYYRLLLKSGFSKGIQPWIVVTWDGGRVEGHGSVRNTFRTPEEYEGWKEAWISPLVYSPEPVCSPTVKVDSLEHIFAREEPCSIGLLSIAALISKQILNHDMTRRLSLSPPKKDTRHSLRTCLATCGCVHAESLKTFEQQL